MHVRRFLIRKTAVANDGFDGGFEGVRYRKFALKDSLWSQNSSDSSDSEVKFTVFSQQVTDQDKCVIVGNVVTVVSVRQRLKPLPE